MKAQATEFSDRLWLPMVLGSNPAGLLLLSFTKTAEVKVATLYPDLDPVLGLDLSGSVRPFKFTDKYWQENNTW